MSGPEALPIPSRSEKEKAAETKMMDGHTLYANRYIVQTYADGAIRLVFGEQYSADLSIGPTFRTAVFLSPSDAVAFLQILQTIVKVPAPTLSDMSPKS